MLLTLAVATTGEAATTNASGEGTGESGTAFSTLIQAGEANLFTGTLTHSVPLVVPPGREMVTPDLKLVYSSDGQEGPFGFGWSLPFLGTVERTTKFGVPRCSAHTNEFTLHLAGGSSELRETSAGSGVYRLETDESFTEARQVNADVSNQKKWIVTERSGLEYTFGDVSSARLFKNLDQIWDYTQTTIPTCELTTVWALTKIRDVNGNSINITYTKDQGSLFPLTIEYGGNDDTGKTIAHPFKVTFGLELRGDPKLSYRRGVREWLAKQVSSIQIETKSAPNGSFSVTRTYTLDYDPSPSGSRSLLKEVAGDLLPTHSFEYLSDTFDHEALLNGYGQNNPKVRDSDGNGAVFRTVMDANGDGFTDLIHAKAAGGEAWEILYGSKLGLVGSTAKLWTFDAELTPIIGDRMERMNSGKVERTEWDVTGDGIMDFVDAENNTTWRVYPGECLDDEEDLFECHFKTASLTYTSATLNYISNPSGQGDKATMLDLNGDGLQDQLRPVMVSGDWHLKVYFGKAEGSPPAYSFEQARAFNWPATFDRDRVNHDVGSGSDRMLFDFNGDGLPDVVERGIGTTIGVYFNQGERFDSTLTPVTLHDDDEAYITRISGGGETKIDFIDINADGLPDRVHWDGINGHTWTVQYNLGTDLTTPPPSGPPLPSLAPLNGPLRHVTGGRGKTNVDLYDWNGDGVMDHMDARQNPWIVMVAKPGGKPNAMAVAKNGLGGEMRVEYEPSTWSDNTGASDNVAKLPFPTWLVKKVRRSDGTCDAPAAPADPFDPAQNPCIQTGNELFQESAGTSTGSIGSPGASGRSWSSARMAPSRSRPSTRRSTSPGGS